ncbi:hypothetical protein Bbelb_159180 [Branchiostoma belcheri]|nr:hypothetical protein Bbelb_159180 [Branchiostoma belcheri]
MEDVDFLTKYRAVSSKVKKTSPGLVLGLVLIGQAWGPGPVLAGWAGPVLRGQGGTGPSGQGRTSPRRLGELAGLVLAGWARAGLVLAGRPRRDWSWRAAWVIFTFGTLGTREGLNSDNNFYRLPVDCRKLGLTSNSDNFYRLPGYCQKLGLTSDNFYRLPGDCRNLFEGRSSQTGYPHDPCGDICGSSHEEGTDFGRYVRCTEGGAAPRLSDNEGPPRTDQCLTGLVPIVWDLLGPAGTTSD